MFIEIAWIERLQRFLGHPVYATTAVLVAFLVFAGLGSLWSQGRVGRERGLLVGAVTAIVILSLAYALELPEFQLTVFGTTGTPSCADSASAWAAWPWLSCPRSWFAARRLRTPRT